MRFVHVKIENRMSMPILQNTRALHKNERLYMYKRKEVKAALQDVTKIEKKPEEEAGAASKPANKRQKVTKVVPQDKKGAGK